MLRDLVKEAGFNIFLGRSEDDPERALGELQTQIRGAEAKFNVQLHSFTLKDENRHWYAIQIATLTPKVTDFAPMEEDMK